MISPGEPLQATSRLPEVTNSETAVLTALDAAKEEAWCFVSGINPVVTYWSQSFLDLWGFPDTGQLVDGRDFRSGILPLNGPAAKEAARRLGIAEDWLQQLSDDFHTSDSSGYHLTIRNDGITVRSASQAILDAKAFPKGWLVECKVVECPELSQRTVIRSLRATRLLQNPVSRESEILGMIYRGLTNKAIALKTSISEKTVEKHRARVMKKLNAKSAAEMIRVTLRSVAAFRCPRAFFRCICTENWN